ncbi:MAG: hypothetical protein LBK68_06285 [Candidatus Margulisbacteria bacterium]|nr:hypothetical protein [Candidatus Margulisiibacteriota bacterium]
MAGKDKLKSNNKIHQPPVAAWYYFLGNEYPKKYRCISDVYFVDKLVITVLSVCDFFGSKYIHRKSEYLCRREPWPLT